MKKTLGTITTYRGSEHPYLRGQRVRIVAVLKHAARSDYDPDADGSYITDEEELLRAGVSPPVSVGPISSGITGARAHA
jgi:hypothetical protein